MPSTLYALVWGIGLFASQDAGGWWDLINREEGVQGLTLVFDAQNLDVIYKGSQYCGAARTMDGGDTWERLFTDDVF